ncbi:uncharacterized protein TRAVEDRAFT_161801 [Trametes versicolor FP-101664 SS1]|uniref:uncharacterized protein n=1 Tax=Trametes versicolor (strain FP-101664) TaxID=717944 RepID=UPI000462171B|nr:uncharacterized protein TRAVEDRAFT_161801 [Trametes versicolor FP-101664 SS1]EIW63468.1 hypothetical protein TRAVEDRAFT_161801 [Trametes versicolor FP-101664 SS1]
MSSSTSTKASIAVLGGTGTLGEDISTVLLTEFRETFPTVRVFTRDPSSSKAQAFAQKGADVVALDIDTLDKALTGIDVVVNVLPTSLSEEVRSKVNEAVIKSGPKVYFLSEFGLDHRVADFSGYEHPEWAGKKRLAAETRKLAQGKTKVIAVYSGVFVEFLVSSFLGPILGFDLANNVFTSYGPATSKFGSTGKSDIGRTVGRLAVLALDPSTSASVPDEVRIAGSTTSYENVRDITARVKGVPKGEIKIEDLDKLEQDLRAQKGKGDFLLYIRLATGKGWGDLSENANELVNPGQKFWKWKTVEDEVRTVTGA